jgi:hypothetical protein
MGPAASGAATAGRAFPGRRKKLAGERTEPAWKIFKGMLK